MDQQPEPVTNEPPFEDPDLDHLLRLQSNQHLVFLEVMFHDGMCAEYQVCRWDFHEESECHPAEYVIRTFHDDTYHERVHIPLANIAAIRVRIYNPPMAERES